jgi:tRNA(Arg) A34 adenosine deaminase TadA
VSARNSTAHAEMVALQLAEQRVGSFDLSEAGEVELVSSVEPCVMCLGAVVWSGVAALVCGARDADARAIGFDEGPKPSDWMGALRARGIDVELGVLHRQAAAVLTDYAAAGGAIYNARRLPT